ncbi:hypothetical protein CROQUDRAFT_467307 [Cronartium quercuum f. sp. fusiforme G11]|uniref:Uncharacterized protein n=1 Tax=Cronartium quercuum f. sp. fusiforme G11 TaxID=708437 RepID=A0A9P6NT92_9BASI|nr:hypothetical protein CROQUDRAFT_467307 [Cronartium quercuum f. sp. fusiforme G11]
MLGAISADTEWVYWVDPLSHSPPFPPSPPDSALHMPTLTLCHDILAYLKFFFFFFFFFFFGLHVAFLAKHYNQSISPPTKPESILALAQ